MDTRKLGKPSDQRLALVSNLATDLLWYGHIETTFDRAKAAATVSKDGVKKLAARRKIIAMVQNRQEQRKKGEKLADFEARTQGIEMPLVEKIFDDLAPKYAERAKESGRKGGYTRVIKTSIRRGDNAQMALVELI